MGSVKKLLPCLFLDNLFCSYRKSEKFTVMARCFECPHYLRLMREMDEEDERVMAEIDRINEFGYPKSFSDFKKGKESKY